MGNFSAVKPELFAVLGSPLSNTLVFPLDIEIVIFLTPGFFMVAFLNVIFSALDEGGVRVEFEIHVGILQRRGLRGVKLPFDSLFVRFQEIKIANVILSLISTHYIFKHILAIDATDLN